MFRYSPTAKEVRCRCLHRCRFLHRSQMRTKRENAGTLMEDPAEKTRLLEESKEQERQGAKVCEKEVVVDSSGKSSISSRNSSSRNTRNRNKISRQLSSTINIESSIIKKSISISVSTGDWRVGGQRAGWACGDTDGGGSLLHIPIVTALYLLLGAVLHASALTQQPTGGEWRAGMVTYQRDGPASISTYLRYLGEIPELGQLTICFRIFLLQARNEIVVISYAKENHDNELYIGFSYDKQEMMLVCCRHEWYRNLKVSVKLRLWSSFCVAMDLVGRKMEVVQDGHIKMGIIETFVPANDLMVHSGGKLYIGQEQDTLGGGFNEFQSLRGSLVDLRVYNSILTTDQMKNYTSCQAPDNSSVPILDFYNITRKFEVRNVEIEQVSSELICEQREEFDIIFPEPRLFQEGELLCRILGGTLKVPISKEDNRKLFLLAESYTTGCSDGVGDILWLGVKGNESSQTWQHFASRAPILYSNFEQNSGQPIEEPEVCVTFKGSRSIVSYAYGKWVPRPCNLERCIACHFEELPFVRIRGLCGKSEFDREYFLLQDNNTVVFIGAYYSFITKHLPTKNSTFSGNFGYWHITRYDKLSITAKLTMKSPTHYPTGLNKWIISNDVCGEQEVTLRMTSCKDQQFSCDDGTCIRLRERCDMEVNCPDGSDEVSCRFLVIPEGYNKMTPPPRRDPSTPINVYLHVQMLSVRAFDLTGFNFVCELEVRIAWHDVRIKFHHLNEAEFLNTIHLTEEQEPWMPKVEFFGDAFTTSDVSERRSFLVAKRVTQPLPDNDENLGEDEIFAGEDNPLVLIKKLTVTTSCQFDLISFPFDTQTCKLGVVLLGLTKDYITLVPEGPGITYVGKRKLLQYYLKDEAMLPHDEANYSGQVVKLTFQNLSTFYITSTYVPTFIIVVIGYLVFYFPVDDFNERIMVALTALLVEAAFFTQTSSNIPQTAYLKLVDIWYVYCIISLFLVVVTVAFLNWCKKCAPACVLGVGRYINDAGALLAVRRAALAAWLNLLCRILCPVLTALFLTFYLVMAALIEIPELNIQLNK
ncbi:uncharacterized protein [Cherax quadricarinatus]|uniref:uncharacterized protein n=1 Tax=Cherax quadricarinatus TaxID=27406 RepID=UPI00387E5418